MHDTFGALSLASSTLPKLGYGIRGTMKSGWATR